MEFNSGDGVTLNFFVFLGHKNKKFVQIFKITWNPH